MDVLDYALLIQEGPRFVQVVPSFVYSQSVTSRTGSSAQSASTVRRPFTGESEMVYSDHEKDMFGHKKLGGMGDRVSNALKALSPKYNQGRRVNVISQRLGYLVRSGDPDALDSIVPMAFGNLALDMILEGRSGLLVAVRNGVYSTVPIDSVVEKSWAEGSAGIRFIGDVKELVDLDGDFDRVGVLFDRLDLGRLEVVEQPAALAHELEEPAARGEIFFVVTQVLGEVVDALTEQRHLHLG